MNDNKTSRTYWDHLWDSNPLPPAMNPHDNSLKNYLDHKFHEYFVSIFSGLNTASQSLIEIGCARSLWLPYFVREFGFNVSGIDYSAIGCQQARQRLIAEGLNGRIIHADFFSPPADMLASFDVAVSFGVVEHFTDTAKCMESFSRLLKPGGLLITVVPNLRGLMGLLQRAIDKRVYDLHIPIGPVELANACRSLGLEILTNDYFLFTHFGVLNMNTIAAGSMHWHLDRIILSLLMKFSIATWWVESIFRPFKGNGLLSPYVICAAKK